MSPFRLIPLIFTLFLAWIAPARGAEDCTAIRGLVLPVEFPYLPHAVSRDFILHRFAVELADYVAEMSYGRFCLKAEVAPSWYKLPAPVSAYSISSRNLQVDKSRVSRLISDVVAQSARDFDLPSYDFVAVMLGAKTKDYGMIGLCAYPGMLGWTADAQLLTPDGRPIKGVAIYSFQAHLGTLFHDMAHVLGGIAEDGRRKVPCLYDHDLQAQPGLVREIFAQAIINMGYWDPMSSHYYKFNSPPTGISSWTRIRLGWMPEGKVVHVEPGQTRDIVLNPLEDGDGATLAVHIALPPPFYYLIENRQPMGFDAELPGHGVLIMKGDMRVRECRFGRSPIKLVNADPSQPSLKGAAFDMDKRTRFTDADNGVTIQLVEKRGASYLLRISVLPDLSPR
ncbi:hypothetical protein [Magnetospirillum sp. 64-120]|uniref:hypothetical protein n=1 Tax=Magnetospirillum sp. 64-120 TaxID=1895778 RepID=UPI00092AA084|nr:hypothetical protein [Magnetospirillum sp. 64-120]OJX78328.1 MAG: hypothetical protein BGO92_02860 [Magnetospirillum sp. 64-120]